MKAKGLVFGVGLVLMFVLAADAVARARMSGSRRGGTGVRSAQEQDDDSHSMETAAETVVDANSFIDPRDGNVYRKVRIGDFTWMAENLNFNTNNSTCHGGDNSSECGPVGRLYAWEAAMTACPAGWRLPTNEDWMNLVNAAGGQNIAGRTLRSRRVGSWSRLANAEHNYTDEFGFSAIPNGAREPNNRFSESDTHAFWWGRMTYRGMAGMMPNMSLPEHGMGIVITWNSDRVYELSVSDAVGYSLSVRCVME